LEEKMLKSSNNEPFYYWNEEIGQLVSEKENI
jgi:hypothetical protein